MWQVYRSFAEKQMGSSLNSETTASFQKNDVTQSRLRPCSETIVLDLLVNVIHVNVTQYWQGIPFSSIGFHI